MLQTCTPNDLMRFMYHETNQAESALINEVILTNYAAREAYDELHQAYRQLPKVSFWPSRKSINSILAYSAETAKR
jgi:hypothetical protein